MKMKISVKEKERERKFPQFSKENLFNFQVSGQQSRDRLLKKIKKSIKSIEVIKKVVTITKRCLLVTIFT